MFRLLLLVQIIAVHFCSGGGITGTTRSGGVAVAVVSAAAAAPTYSNKRRGKGGVHSYYDYDHHRKHHRPSALKGQLFSQNNIMSLRHVTYSQQQKPSASSPLSRLWDDGDQRRRQEEDKDFQPTEKGGAAACTTSAKMMTSQLVVDSIVQSISRGGGGGNSATDVIGASSSSPPQTALLLYIFLMILQGISCMTNPSKNLLSYLLPPYYSQDAYNTYNTITNNPTNILLWKFFGTTTLSLGLFVLCFFFISPKLFFSFSTTDYNYYLLYLAKSVRFSYLISNIPWWYEFVMPIVNNNRNRNAVHRENLLPYVAMICATYSLWGKNLAIYQLISLENLAFGLMYWLLPKRDEFYKNELKKLKRTGITYNGNADDAYTAGLKDTETLLRRYGSSLLLYGTLGILLTAPEFTTNLLEFFGLGGILATSSTATSVDVTTNMMKHHMISLGITLLVGVLVVGKTHFLHAPQFKTQSKVFSPLMFATMAIIIFTSK